MKVRYERLNLITSVKTKNARMRAYLSFATAATLRKGNHILRDLSRDELVPVLRPALSVTP